MPLAADFRVVNDIAHKLGPADTVRFSCEIPSHLSREGGQPQSYVLVKYLLEGASALTWQMRLNGSRLLDSSGSGSHLLMTIEAFDALLLLPGLNEFEIEVTHGLGIVRIADIVVHFHVHL